MNRKQSLLNIEILEAVFKEDESRRRFGGLAANLNVMAKMVVTLTERVFLKNQKGKENLMQDLTQNPEN